jgi:hypothetical protein
LVGDAARLLEVGQVPHDGRGASVLEVAHGREPIRVASVDDDLVPVFEQRLRGRPSETVCGTGDEDTCDEILRVRGLMRAAEAMSLLASWAATEEAHETISRDGSAHTARPDTQ